MKSGTHTHAHTHTIKWPFYVSNDAHVNVVVLFRLHIKTMSTRFDNTQRYTYKMEIINQQVNQQQQQ